MERYPDWQVIEILMERRRGVRSAGRMSARVTRIVKPYDLRRAIMRAPAV